MIMGSPHDCCGCNAENDGMIWSELKKGWLCVSCMCKYHPPYITLIKFHQGSYKKLWNLEMGVYEDFHAVEDLEWCDWIVRSRQDTLYRLVPRVSATVYHMEYQGDILCGRCMHYKYFDDTIVETCMAQACEYASGPRKPKKEIQYPHMKSRYVKWTMG